ncbi:hypothetical protein AH259_11305 [Salmonella enterica subsp. enterica]|nr:hypothetical protein [Salmonella enterica subsp. enterica]EJS4816556.1 tail fiber assembly protein [Salmonella enterica subsp. enterica serovar Ouakam]
MYLFSPEKRAFYPAELRQNYIDAGTLPEDVIEVEDSVRDIYNSQPPSGKMLGVDSASHPVWVDIPSPEPDELYESELKSINDAYEADKIILRDAYLNALLFDGPTEQTKRTAIYNQLLARNQVYASDIENLEQKYGG